MTEQNFSVGNDHQNKVTTHETIPINNSSQVDLAKQQEVTNTEQKINPNQSAHGILLDLAQMKESSQNSVVSIQEYLLASHVSHKQIDSSVDIYPVVNHDDGNTLSKGIVEQQLPQGGKITIIHEAAQKTPGLLKPDIWEETQLVRRVHMIDVPAKNIPTAKRRFILKERQVGGVGTARLESLTSEEEFNTAREIATGPFPSSDELKLGCEIPVGYGEDPNKTREYSLYTYEDRLKANLPEKELTQAILQARKSYKEEYTAIKIAAEQFVKDHKALLEAKGPGNGGMRDPNKLSLANLFNRGLTFKEFAIVKAHILIQEARDKMNAYIASKGYYDQDNSPPDFLYDVHPTSKKGGRPQLEAVLIDFEVFRKEEETARYRNGLYESLKAGGEIAKHAAYTRTSRPVMLAASYLMLDKIGIALPN